MALLATRRFVAGLQHCFQSWRKPFNPILGETWQATLSNGTTLYLEQISHHPPISAFQMIGPGAQPPCMLPEKLIYWERRRAWADGQNSILCADGEYHFSGYSQPEVQYKVQSNAVKTTARGKRRITFADGTVIEITYPHYYLRGGYHCFDHRMHAGTSHPEFCQDGT